MAAVQGPREERTASMRQHMNHEELEASRILDLAKAGGAIGLAIVARIAA